MRQKHQRSLWPDAETDRVAPRGADVVPSVTSTVARGVPDTSSTARMCRRHVRQHDVVRARSRGLASRREARNARRASWTASARCQAEATARRLHARS